MTNNDNQQIKAKQFHKLHHSGKMLVLPNIWDSLGAVLLESLQYPAIATASASMAFTNGYNDGENLPFNDFLTLLTKITKSVAIPVTADIESGYASGDKQLEENIKQFISTGIVGINIEDSDKATNTLIPTEIQCNKIRLIKSVSAKMGISLFINVRTDVYIHGEEFETAESKLEETIKRGLAYKSAGADCFYPIVMRQEQDIKKTIEQLQMPINILTLPGIPELSTLNKMGVARVSLGPSFLKIAIRAMKDIAVKLKNYEGLPEITKNEITSDYLKDLVNKNY
ncbi:MAG: isocitrate lyase/phosphoenolpyruvate mutase family protein [Lutibacter sp.]|jgi:2-methylisocitrate lyase-like PEP mutase family enzyme